MARSEVLQRVCAPNSSPVILMTGEAGWGKTAFAAHLFNTDPTGRLLAAHFCRNDRPDTVDPHRFVENIAALTALRVEPYNERLRTLIGAHPESLAIPSAAEKFERLFLEPLDAAGRARHWIPCRGIFWWTVLMKPYRRKKKPFTDCWCRVNAYFHRG